MKDSGVEWIGEIPEGWEVGKTLYALSMPITDGPHETPELQSDGIPFVSAEAVSSGVIDFEHIRGFISREYYDQCCKKYIPQRNDILMVKSGATTGVVVKVDTDCIFTIWSPLAVFRANELIMHYDYLYYFLLSDALQTQIANKWSYGTQQNIGMRMLEKLILCFPQILEQHKIARFLKSKCAQIDAIIEKQQQIIEKLKAYKQSVITEAVTKGLDPAVPMKDSGVEWIGMVPEHWHIPKLMYVASISSGGTPDRNHPEYWDGNINWIKTGELLNQEIWSADEKITELGLMNSSAKVFPEDTLLVAMYGQGKTRGMTALLKVPATTNQACAGIRVIDKSVSVHYLWMFFICAYDAIREIAAGSGQPNLSSTLINNFRITVPSIHEQDRILNYINHRCSKIDEIISMKTTTISKLGSYKKSLIYEAVTGKLEV